MHDSCEVQSLFSRLNSAESDFESFRNLCDADFDQYKNRRRLLAPEIRPSGSFMQRLKASTQGVAYDRGLQCLRPQRRLADLQRRHSFDRDLLQLKLKNGRVCRAELCSLDRCGLHVRDGVLSAAEADQLVAHAQGALDSEGTGAYDHDRPYRRVDFLRSAHNGSIEGHVLSLRIAERMRRIAAQVFGLPLPRVGVAETLLALRRFEEMPRAPRAPPTPGLSPATSSSAPASLADRGSKQYALEASATAYSNEPESAWHCDESLSPAFHFTSIVWLSEHGRDFQGGELAFLHNQTIPWMLLEPAAGRAAFFSSGWENIHGIKPLTAGARWAFSVPFMVNDELEQIQRARKAEDLNARRGSKEAARGSAFRELCVRPINNQAFRECRETWAAKLTRSSAHDKSGDSEKS